MTSSAAADPAVTDGVVDRAVVRSSLPPQVRGSVDALFEDADRHGPRVHELLGRTLLAIGAVVAALALTAWEPWRALVFDLVGAGVVLDPALLAPVVLATVVAAALMAPLARVSTSLVLPPVLVLGAVTYVLVAEGHLVAATLPATLAALGAGAVAARTLRRAVWALPVLIAASISDAHSVARGVTRSLLDDASTAGTGAATSIGSVPMDVPASVVTRLDYVVIHVPVADGMWLLGLVDLVALALLLGLTHLHWLPVGRTALVLGCALVVAVTVGSAIPMLPLLGAAWVLVHARLVWRSTRFSLRRLTYLGG